MRLDLGTAECTLGGWIPLELRIDALTDVDGAAALSDAATELVAELGIVIEEVDVRGGQCHLLLVHADQDDKDVVYKRCISALIADLLESIEEGRAPRVGIAAGSAAVALAEAATEAADRGCTVSP
jgi:hypothetical protein